jgi:hypothetical protein
LSTARPGPAIKLGALPNAPGRIQPTPAMGLLSDGTARLDGPILLKNSICRKVSFLGDFRVASGAATGRRPAEGADVLIQLEASSRTSDGAGWELDQKEA